MEHIRSLFKCMETACFWFFSFFSLRSLWWSWGDDQTWVVTYFIEKYLALSHIFRDNLCIVTHLALKLYNMLSTYALVMLSLQWIPKQYMFYLNGLNLYFLLLILNCWGRLLLSVSFWKRDVLKFKFLGLLFTGPLLRIFLRNFRPLFCRVWFLLYILVLLLKNLIVFHVDYLP
jgi:hypothetical protein